MNFDIERARKETPGCQEVLHFNNAGAALMPKAVIEAVSEHFQLEIYQGGYEAAEIHGQKIKNFYTSAAKLIHCSPEEIAYAESATRAWDMAFYSIPLKKGDRIVTAEAEYASNYIAFLQVAKRTGAVIDVVPNDPSGQLSIEALKQKIAPDVKLIAITHVPTQGGLVNPAEAVGQIAKESHIFYLLDATQSVGQMPIDVEKIGCDALCATGRKYLRGPRGTGFLYVSKSRLTQLDPPFLDLHAATWTDTQSYEIKNDATRFETWERNYSNMIGLGQAIDYALEWGMDAIWKRISSLASHLRHKLSENPRITLRDLGQLTCGIVTFTMHGLEPSEIKKRLNEKKINVSVSIAEYARLDMQKRHLDSLVRSSVHYYNTADEIDLFCKQLSSL
jgi:cysteine desulfurase / selenocysteine lyase